MVVRKIDCAGKCVLAYVMQSLRLFWGCLGGIAMGDRWRINLTDGVCGHRQNRARAYRKSCFVSGFVFFVLIAIISSGYYVLRCERVHEEYCIRLPHILDHDVYQVIAWALLISSVLLIAMGTYTRCGIRRRFGLPGSDVGDCLLWTFCYPCALCQESRTLQVNNVQDGEWYGPPGGTVIPVQAMPRPPVGSSYPYQQYQPPRVVQQYQQPSASAPPVTGIPFLEAQAPPFEKV